jgi:hypothetical protein
VVLLGRGYDGNCPTLLRTLDGEYDLAGDLGKQCVILTHADVVTRMKFSATLAHDNAARADQFAAIARPLLVLPPPFFDAMLVAPYRIMPRLKVQI